MTSGNSIEQRKAYRSSARPTVITTLNFEIVTDRVPRGQGGVITLSRALVHQLSSSYSLCLAKREELTENIESSKPDWTEEYFLIEGFGQAQCLICLKTGCDQIVQHSPPLGN